LQLTAAERVEAKMKMRWKTRMNRRVTITLPALRQQVAANRRTRMNIDTLLPALLRRMVESRRADTMSRVLIHSLEEMTVVVTNNMLPALLRREAVGVSKKADIMSRALQPGVETISRLKTI
jgi:hypothetical protein